MKATTETLRSVLRTSRGQPILKLQSAEQRASLALDVLSLGSRAALGGSFLLSVSDRLGFYGNPGERGVSWGTFEQFLGYAAKVNAFAPAWMIPFLGTAATVLEHLFGVTLVFGLLLRWAAFGSAGLLFLFGSAMAISFGIKSPFDYSVFSAMCRALFLGLAGSNRWTVDSLTGATVRPDPARAVDHSLAQSEKSARCRARDAETLDVPWRKTPIRSCRLPPTRRDMGCTLPAIR